MRALRRAFAVTLSLVLMTVAGELSLRLFLQSTPIRFQGLLPHEIYVLAQSSKRGVIPKDYVAILGDSYAQGAGEWYRGSNQWKNTGSASQHVLHEMTGRDVISFGQSGNGSLAGLVGTPINVYENLNGSFLYRLQSPKSIAVYFYAGNDLDDKIEDHRKRFLTDFEQPRIHETEYFAKFIQTSVIEGSQIHRSKFAFLSHLRFAFVKTVQQAIELIYDKRKAEATRRWAKPTQPAKEGINRVLVNGKSLLIPDHLQGPGLELTEDERDLALYVFEQSLDYVRGCFKDARLVVVYVPAPVSCYSFTSTKSPSRTFRADRMFSMLPK